VYEESLDYCLRQLGHHIRVAAVRATYHLYRCLGIKARYGENCVVFGVLVLRQGWDIQARLRRRRFAQTSPACTGTAKVFEILS